MRKAADYLKRKWREAKCFWRHFGHPEVEVLGGGGGWEVWVCRRCKAYRVGPLNFFDPETSDGR